jgi:hypothetical protein
MFKKTFNSINASWPFLIGLFLGIYFIALNITGKSFTHFPGDLGDGRFNNYILEHAHKYFTGQIHTFWDAPFMYPAKDVITFSDNLLGSAPFYSIFRIIGFDRETSYQWWFLMMFILNFTSCYFFLNWCFKNKYSAVLGAMVFTFSMALQSQMTHSQTFPRFPIPLAFWMCCLFKNEMNPKYFFLALLFVIYQFYCGMYLGFMLSVFIAVFLIVIIINRRDILKTKIKNKKWLATIAASVVLNILIILPLMIPYMSRAAEIGVSTYGTARITIPRIESFFFSQPGSLFWDFLANTNVKYPAYWDYQIFVGGVAMLCIFIFGIFILIKIIKKDSFEKLPANGYLSIICITGLIISILFIRFGYFSLYAIIYIMPGFGSMRCITRVINVELIFFAFATAFVFNLVLKKQNMFSILIFILAAGLFIADNYYKEGSSYRTKKRVTQNRVNLLIEKMKNLPKGSVVSYEPEKVTDSSYIFHIDAMLAAQSLGLKTVNGYSGGVPKSYIPYCEKMTAKTREDYFNSVGLKIDTVYVIH